MAIQNIPGGINAYQKLSGLENNQQNTSQAQISMQSKESQSLQISADQVTIRNEKQASLVAHLFGDPNKAIEDSLKMTFQAAIGKLNEILKEDLGEHAISEENLEKQGGMEYWTPENTAKRILDGASGFLSGFQAAHPELEGEALIDRYMEVVGGGLNAGFEEAKGILGDLKVFDGLVEENYTSTFDLVQLGMQDIRNRFLGIEPEVETPNTETASKE